MNITLHNLGRRFNQEWIFRRIDYTFSSNQKYAILGPNGSGKSTLIKTLTGQLAPSEGTLDFSIAGVAIPIEQVYSHVSIAAPYIELVEEFTLNELLDFHFKFKSYLAGFDKDVVVDLLGLGKSRSKELKYFSSGMKQRVKLALACCSDSNLLFLDEPTSNMDLEGEAWYLDLVHKTSRPDRVLIIGSNQEKEYAFCDSFLSIVNYK
ncbi:ABC transporter ATP-binding protein [Sphingobacterium yanglingense]|uniref:ABC-type multidrug transport system ATPase subunit n=1 Tax=Sphingobacterium yanglingense TaxID=1437280 RepID=A0A4R6WD48_9SPHI|nr:ATP-binding cassette domain-containing protein [Sphingobacterium yanglingense]TDQ75878.1 ABC-type multidrug transport system ATPase subunit [Sphingobacterium yanglingense]